MNRNLVGSIYGRFCIKFPYLVQIGKQTWPSREILVFNEFLREIPFRKMLYNIIILLLLKYNSTKNRMVVGFITTYTTYHH
jgi:hypothetical protein